MQHKSDDAGIARRERVEIARLDLIADNLPMARWQLPAWVCVALFALTGPFQDISTGLTPGLIAWSALQCLVALSFHLVHVGWPRGALTGWRGWRRDRVYNALYAASGLGWGLFPWVSLNGENAASIAVTAISLVAVTAVYSSRVSPHPRSYAIATTALALGALPAFVVHGGDVAIVTYVSGPIWLAMLQGSVKRQSRRIGEMIETRLDNEALLKRVSEARDDAEQASRAKSQFLANMSHELRTPLNAILGFSDLMKSGLYGELDTRYRTYAEDIHGSGEHLLALINDLLDIAKIESGRMQIAPEAIDPAEELQRIARLLGTKAREKQQTLSVALDAAPGELLVDARSFRQIALNLASNAVKFTQSGGAIEIGLRAEGTMAVFWVRDDGPGIAPDKLARLFRPFERVDNSYSGAGGGSGLGLALVKALAGLHGGVVAIDSDLGEGTTVTVRFPGAALMVRRALAA